MCVYIYIYDSGGGWGDSGSQLRSREVRSHAGCLRDEALILHAFIVGLPPPPPLMSMFVDIRKVSATAL